MGNQLDLFGAPPAAKGPEQCVHHGPREICTLCPERPGTGASGFPHAQDARGRTPLRQCHHCRRFVTMGNWNLADWYHCLACVPLGEMSSHGNARAVKMRPEQDCWVPGFGKKVAPPA